MLKKKNKTFLENIKIKMPKIKINFTKIKKNYIWVVAGILIVTVILARSIGKITDIFSGETGDKEEIAEIHDTVPVKVYKLKRIDFKDTLPVMGRVEGSKEIDLKFDSKGILESFNFEEGERMLEGDIIASLNQKDALLKLKYAALEMEKTKKMYDLGGVDKLAVDQKKLEYESSKRELEKTNIYAHSDGYLGSKDVDSGAFITSQDKIGTFVDFSEVCAIFDVIEEDSSKMELGQNAEIFLDAYPGGSYTGTVDTIAPLIEGRTRTQKVSIKLDNEKNEMKPGMFARAIINTYESKDALIIPSAAFKKQENKYYVYVVKSEDEIEEETEEEGLVEEGLAEADEMVEKMMAESEDGDEIGIIERREITIEYLTHEAAEIGGGIEEGELIVRELHREYKDGDRVEITEVQETIF
ncbi:MAG: efflux RND transporter periplasmic adaptor subunit [Candidatus Omnitrophica bacterium]|nr:efflux RND transporter periplasmic adaptor subunit [Candidatus Omnitrophota bacterium]